MTYGFIPEEPLSDGVRRIGCAQIDVAIGHLTGVAEAGVAVHLVRKSLKRTRALMRLARPAIGERAFVRENKSLRDIARGLAHLRDSQAMIEAVTRLEQRPRSDGVAPAVKDWLLALRLRAQARLSDGQRAGAVNSLREVRRRIGQLHAKDGFGKFGEGLRLSYKRGRKSFRRAYATGADAQFHEWRKDAQLHWRHMQLLRAAWPETLEPRAEAAKELSRILGEDHDLHVLLTLIERHGARFGPADRLEALVSLCREEQADLKQAARPLGARLFCERATPFRLRIAAYWTAAGAGKGSGNADPPPEHALRA